MHSSILKAKKSQLFFAFFLKDHVPRGWQKLDCCNLDLFQFSTIAWTFTDNETVVIKTHPTSDFLAFSLHWPASRQNLSASRHMVLKDQFSQFRKSSPDASADMLFLPANQQLTIRLHEECANDCRHHAKELVWCHKFLILGHPGFQWATFLAQTLCSCHIADDTHKNPLRFSWCVNFCWTACGKAILSSVNRKAGVKLTFWVNDGGHIWQPSAPKQRQSKDMRNWHASLEWSFHLWCSVGSEWKWTHWHHMARIQIDHAPHHVCALLKGHAKQQRVTDL